MENTKSKLGYIRIENKGEMDINALLLLGATNKRDNEAMIGFFGSGLKYAVAVLLKMFPSNVAEVMRTPASVLLSKRLKEMSPS